MVQVLNDFAQKSDCEEVYEVVKTAVVVKYGKTYRVEVWKSYSKLSKPFTVSCSVEEEIEGHTVWVDYELSHTDRDDVDSTLAQALSFLPNAKQAATA
jgi:hypothetical protein